MGACWNSTYASEEETMPYVNIKITRENVTAEQKAALIKGVTDLLVTVLNKNPATTVVVIDEVALEDWGIGGLPVEEYRRQQKAAKG
ncbi:4-oxalocrotonate tautomerase family protein [Pararhizobium sp. BT-229]|uniref:tautomerase family protein n=1 Tax=Pararhizobium sp. BT-229 TaxID=2986923 RepID=UPI0021F6B118|nr:4-oxalocrotonate tautomerase family protein [Pararhizobium sp. BT-229]MCV9963406.1 4-oxalocrotonate tautomerase family protein [Pararhizobium sp. BT-229]